MNINQKGSNNELKAAALEYASKGTPVFPLVPSGKTPIHKGGFHNATTNPAIISRWWDENPDANIGMPTGPASNCWVLDVDNKSANGFHSLIEWEGQGRYLPATRIALTPNRGKHSYFNWSTLQITNSTGVVPGVDVRGEGGYVVLPPSRLVDGRQYEWQDPNSPIADAPQWLLDLVVRRGKPESNSVLIEMPDNVIPNGCRNDTLVRMAGSMRRYGANEEQIFTYLRDTNIKRCALPLDESEVRQIASGAQRWDPASHEFALTDSGNAELLAYLNKGCLLYDHRLSRWLVWQLHWWAEDITGEVNRLAKQAARKRQARASDISDEDKRKATRKFALKSENRSAIEACIQLSKYEDELSDAGDRWDAEPLLLGVGNGVIDLKTGLLRNGSPSDRISLHANVNYDPDATCPRWEQFMEEIFLGNRELISYVKRAVGYSLTGITSEHVMFIAHGAGANGKSVMLRVLVDLLGGYAKVTPSSTLDTGNKSNISNDVAALVNRRLVWASETEQTSTLNEAKVKQLVHGDETTARKLYQEFFTFTPIAKIWYTVNDLPTVRDSSHGMWRSLHVIPFDAKFDGDKADPGLTDKLKAEFSGILNWAILGCLAWQKEGLRLPSQVNEATTEYRNENDVLGEFLGSYCELGEGLSTPATALYRAYTQWAESCGLREHEILRTKSFYKRLKSMFKSNRTNKGVVYLGLEVVAPMMEPR